MSNNNHKETKSFQAEVKQVLDLMIHSLYSNKEIFLRELISNAADAADKLRFEALSDDALFEGDADLHVWVEADKDARTVTIRDNGIGMSRDEVMDNIGTIAKSGTRQFIDKMTGDKVEDSNLIGQFGVGFYSAFIVADKVTLTTRRAGAATSEGVRWESEGAGEYDISDIERTQRGTEVVLHLREDENEFLDDYRLKSIVHKYSEHTPVPIRMMGTAPITEDDEASEAGEDTEKKEPEAIIETINQAAALWTRSASEISDEEYDSFYKSVSHDYEAPMARMHKRLEGKFEYTLMMFIPNRAPFDLWYQESKHGVKLYVRRVFIMEVTEDLLPRYLRFMRGVIDTNDLPLNVSREILQRHPAMDAIKKGAVKRVLGMIEDLGKDAEQYQKFYNEFGNALKEGIIEDSTNGERLAKLLRFHSTHDTTAKDATVSLAAYSERMLEGQEKIYYITADSLASAKNSPHLEVFAKKGIEVLLLHDRIDEWLGSHLTEFDGKSLQSISKGKLDLSGIGEEDKKDEDEKKDEAIKPILEKLSKFLESKVQEVRETDRLTESPSCLVSDEFAMSTNMERILKEAGQQTPGMKPILEINPDHALVKALNDDDDDKLEQWAHVLFDQAVLSEGGQLEDPSAFVRRMNSMLLQCN